MTSPVSTTEVETAILLKELRINYPDALKVQYTGFTEAIDMMRNKQIDGAWVMDGIFNVAVSKKLSNSSGKLLPFKPSLIDSLNACVSVDVIYELTKTFWKTSTI